MPAAHKRVQVYGTLVQQTGYTPEIFSFGFADMSAKTPQQLAVIVDTILNAHYADGTGMILQLSSVSIYGGTRVESIDATGKVTDSYTAQNTGNHAGANSSWGNTVCCCALSLETGQYDNKGRLIRGRIYPPAAPGSVLGATFLLTNLDTYVVNWAKFFQAVNDGGGAVAVASSTNVGLVPVTGISADNVVDTQRRRKNAITGSRSPVSVINAG